MSNLFSELKELGFDNVDNIKIYSNNEDRKNPVQEDSHKKINPLDYLYDKTYNCPVCKTEFKARTVKVSKVRLAGQDTDFMPLYDNINPLFYDVIICPKCGYGAMIGYFDKIRQYQIQLVLNNITPKFKPKKYPEIYDVDIAIERYKYSLLNSIIKDAKTSEKAYNCLKIAWMYRLKGDNNNENKFLEQAFIGFKESFGKDQFPICGMDQFTLMYLIGELARRLNKNDEALIWFSKVIVSKDVRPKLKEMAREQKELIKK